MKKAKLYYLVFLVMAALALSLAVSSALLWVVFPRGFYPARRLWVDIHRWGGLVLSLTVLVHAALHWRWILRMTHRCLGPAAARAERDERTHGRLRGSVAENE